MMTITKFKLGKDATFNNEVARVPRLKKYYMTVAANDNCKVKSINDEANIGRVTAKM